MLHYLQGLLSALDLTSLLDAVLRVAAIFLCLTVHETCHGLAALALGDPTAKSMHRLSLNPLRHIDWIGLLMMFVAGFGWAKPVPVDPRYFRKPKQGMALTALAGPVSNFVLAVLAMLISKVIYLYTPYSAGDGRGVQLLPVHAGASVHRSGVVQFDSHPAAGWVQGAGGVSAGPAVHHADAV